MNVNVKKWNELSLKISCEKQVALELYEFFTFYVPGYKFMPKFRDGLWDGQIHLFNTREMILPFGLLVDLIKFCKNRSYQIIIDDKEAFRLCKPSDDDIEELLTGRLDKISKLSPEGKYKYQLDAVLKCLELNKALVLSPTGSGKSHIIYLLIRFLIDFISDDILIVVPSTNLVEQMYGDFQSYINDDWNLEEHCSKLYGGKDKNTRRRALISTWQSIYKNPPEFFSRFGAMFCDEAHLATAASIKGIVSKMPKACFRLGFTGTLKGTKCHEMDLKGMFGPVFNTQTTRGLQDDGVLTHLEIDIVILEYSNEDRKALKQFQKQRSESGATVKYQDEMKWITNNPHRNMFIAKTAIDMTGNTLILFNYVDKHGKVLYDLIRDMAVDDRPVFYVSGITKVAERETVRQKTEEGSGVIIVASSAIFSTGMNIKNLANLIMAHPFKTRIRNLQSIGRILRLSSQKSKAKVVDIIDDLSYNRKSNISYNHGVGRIELYESENFKYKIRKLSMETL